MDEIILERPEPAIAVLRLNRPEARNAINAGLRNRLLENLSELSHDVQIRCVIIAGSDKVFAGGADIKSMAQMSSLDIERSGSDRLYAAVRQFRWPVIAAVNGFALGGGCELALSADIIVAGEGARFGQPEIKVGIMPGGGGSQRLVRSVGRHKAMKLLLTGEAVAARDAEAMGMVSEVVADTEVLSRALELARTIASMPPIAVARIKQVVSTGEDLPFDAALMLERQAFTGLFATADQKEGMAAFLEKRKPQYRGE